MQLYVVYEVEERLDNIISKLIQTTSLFCHACYRGAPKRLFNTGDSGNKINNL